MKNRTNLIFAHNLLKGFADSLIKAFIPLIILKNSGSLLMVFVYLNAYYFLCGIFYLILKKFLQKYGLVAIMLHIIPIIVAQILLSTLPMTWWLIIVLALVMCFAQVLYYVPLNTIFSISDKDANVAKFSIATNVGKMIFLLLSGYVLGADFKNNILILCIVATVLYLVSVVPIMFGYGLLKNSYLEKVKNPPRTDKKSYLPFNIWHMCFGIYQNVMDVILPIYLFVNHLDFQAVAIVMVLVEACKVGANLFAKFLVKKKLSFLSCCISVVTFLAGCIVILIVKVPVVLYICSCLIAISFPLLNVPMFGVLCKKLRFDNNQTDGMFYRDVYILPSKDIMLVWWFAFPIFELQFAVGMAGSLGMLICSRLVLKKNGSGKNENKKEITDVSTPKEGETEAVETPQTEIEENQQN
ncbi:MAG: MFS transporter [Clostridia bacterium]|nr:MFS transporter [Clostridia bacterium]